MAGMNQKYTSAVGGGLVFAGDDARAVFSSVVGRPFSTVQTVLLTMKIPQLLVDMVVNAPVVQDVQVVRVSQVLVVKITVVIP